MVEQKNRTKDEKDDALDVEHDPEILKQFNQRKITDLTLQLNKKSS